MSANLKKDIQRELQAAYELLRVLTESQAKLEARIKALEDKRGPGRPKKS